MKKIYLLFLSLFSLTAFAQQTFPGNGKTGFGGAVGTGSLTISDNATNITFTLNRGAGALNDFVVYYLDFQAGGFTTTANFTDFGSTYRQAISGYDGTGRATLNFPAGFTPEYAAVFDKDEAYAYVLTANGSHVFIGSIPMSGSTTDAIYTGDISKSALGATTPTTFNFLVTYLGFSGRSNEFIGDAGSASNPIITPYTATSYLTYTTVVPVTLVSFEAIGEDGQISLKWTVAQEVNISRYDVMRSADGINFSKIGSVNATGNSMEHSYIFNDNNPLSGNSFYKLNVVEVSGETYSSKIISLNGNSSRSFKSYTNASGNVLMLNINAATNKHFDLEIMNTSGQRVFKSKLNTNGNSNKYSVNLNKTLAPGIYSVSLSDADERFSELIMIK